jgi:hypothetical protein
MHRAHAQDNSNNILCKNSGLIHSGALIVHFFLFHKAKAIHKGTSHSLFGWKGPNSPCITPHHQCCWTQKECHRKTNDNRRTMIHSNVLRGVRIEKFGTIVISSSCAKKSTCTATKRTTLSHTYLFVSRKNERNAPLEVWIRGYSVQITYSYQIFIHASVF